jgi:PhoD-like phosphatase
MGPLMRYVDETSASIWLETAGHARATVHAGERSWTAETFCVHDHHYALVEVDGLEQGSITPYSVDIDGTTVWPVPESPYPPSVIAALKQSKRLRLAYGSCRTSGPNDAQGNESHGVDALRALAFTMATDRTTPWPDVVLFLGDQIYADQTTKEMRDFIESRRDINRPPGAELKDYEEYAHLYRLAWSDDLTRWLLSTLPSMMIFDDHDIRDDWNTSLAWREQMELTSWWHERIVAGLGSCWVYQHLGNLSPAERADDPMWRLIAAHTSAEELDLTDRLDEFAEGVDKHPDGYRWSFARDFNDVRLVVVDSRSARTLEPGNRSMIDADELAWVDEQMRGGFRHLLVGTSLPFLLPGGLHHIEAWDEAVADGAWGKWFAGLGERLRQRLDLEHWAAFHDSFLRVAALAGEVADGRRGRAPDTVTFLSGDVHHSYVAEVRRPRVRGRGRIVQAVCSPIRNPLPRRLRFAVSLLSYGLAGPLGAAVSRLANVPATPFTWHRLRGPWFDNTIATLEDSDDGLVLTWDTGVVDDDLRPRLENVSMLVLRPF